MRCKAKSKQSGQQCKKNAVQGYEVCEIHGGKTPRGMNSRHWKHGNNSIYRDFLPEQIKTKVAAFENADPLDLTHELAITRGLLAEFLSRFVTGTNLDAISISIASDLIDRINKTVATISKIKNDTALTGAEVTFLAMRMITLLDRYVDDADKREAFKQEIFSLAVPANTDLITIEADHTND